MVILAELRAAGTAVMRLPGASRQAGCTAVRDLGGRGEHLSVLLVHGYAGTDAAWEPLCSALGRPAGSDRNHRQLPSSGHGMCCVRSVPVPKELS